MIVVLLIMAIIGICWAIASAGTISDKKGRSGGSSKDNMDSFYGDGSGSSGEGFGGGGFGGF